MCDSLSKNSYDSTIKSSKRLKINVLEWSGWIESDIKSYTIDYLYCQFVFGLIHNHLKIKSFIFK